MSRVGKNEVVVPEGVNFSIEGRILSVKGKLGELTEEITDLVKVEYKDNKVSVKPSSKDKDSYFLNFSDGMPMFGNDDIDYHHDTAIDHTNKMVKMIRDRGVKVLSYFIGDEYDMERSTRTFKRMYGNDAEFIDVTSVLPVAKTMNKTFLKK